MFLRNDLLYSFFLFLFLLSFYTSNKRQHLLTRKNVINIVILTYFVRLHTFDYLSVYENIERNQSLWLRNFFIILCKRDYVIVSNARMLFILWSFLLPTIYIKFLGVISISNNQFTVSLSYVIFLFENFLLLKSYLSFFLNKSFRNNLNSYICHLKLCGWNWELIYIKL